MSTFTITVSETPSLDSKCETVIANAATEVNAGVGRGLFMSQEERGFYNLMREGFRQDDCPLTLLQKFRAKQAYKRRPQVRDDMVDMFVDLIDDDLPQEDKAKLGALVGCDSCETVTGKRILELAADEDKERNWKDFGDAMVKVWKVIFDGLSKLLPIFFG